MGVRWYEECEDSVVFGKVLGFGCLEKESKGGG